MEMANSKPKGMTEKQIEQKAEQLKNEFEEYRKNRYPGQPIPQPLRQTVLTAIKEGMPESIVIRTCRVTNTQLDYWRKNIQATSPSQQGGPIAKPQVFTVTPSPPPGEKSEKDVALSLRIGHWHIRLSLMNGQGDEI
jgi:hypothetical protein